MKKYTLSLVLCFLIGALNPTPGSAQERIVIAGSDTMETLVGALAKAYMEEHPDSEIVVTGEGSAAGIESLISGTCEIANASRVVTPIEVARAASKGLTIRRMVIGLDGLAIIVHHTNPIKSMTMNEVGQVFRGEIDNWKALNGKNAKISLYGRNPQSGTFAFFAEHVLRGIHADRMKQLKSTQAIEDAVRADPAGIGYVGIGYLKNAEGLKILPIAASAETAPILPTDLEAVQLGRYPLSRPLNQYFTSSLSERGNQFFLFELGEKGQAIVRDQNFYPVPKDYSELNKKAFGE